MTEHPAGGQALVDTVDASHSARRDTMAGSDTLAVTAGGKREVGELSPGAHVGRYLLIDKIGVGAMGVVYAAYDPKLDRKVALKLLKAHDTQDARARLEREAQALAKLAHPNVVSVYDVDVHGSQLYVTMEFIEGRTLGSWMREARRGGQPHSWRQIVDRFMAAGRGLAAAHAAGLVHRDFKPDNVMLGDDGRVRVMDFGLARPEGSSMERTKNEQLSRSAALVDSVSRSKSALETPMTRTGAMMGTPAYMAPEQFSGNADARSDQFGFCVALYEALHGERPFTGESLGALFEASSRGELASPPPRTQVPNWLRSVVVRGLAPEPGQRWPSMDALLDALGDDPAQRRRRWAMVTAIMLMAGSIAGLAWATQRDTDHCAGFEAHLAGVWDAEREALVQAAIEDTGVIHAPQTWERVDVLLDDYTDRWLAERTQTCEASQRGEQSGELLDLRMRCLDERLLHLDATVGVLEKADANVVNKAVQAAAGLPRLEHCADADALAAERDPPDDPQIAKRVAAVDELLIEATALRDIGQYERGLELATAAMAEADELGYEPLRVRASVAVGFLQDMTGAYEQAETTLERAYALALELEMTAEAADASRHLIWVVGYEQSRFEQGRQWAKSAAPLARALGTDNALAAYLVSVGAMALKAGEYAQARGHFEQALARTENMFGPDHLDNASPLTNLGNVARREGKIDEARAYQQRALTIKETNLGSNHPGLSTSLNSLGNLALDEGNYTQARAYLERALAISEGALGPDHPTVAMSLGNVANVALRQEKFTEARALQERALAINERAFGVESPRVGANLVNLGNVANEAGEYADGRDQHGRALTILERALGPDHPNVAYPLTGLGQALLGLDTPADAIPYLERSLVIRSSNRADNPSLASTRFLLARALWGAATDAGGDRARAHELAALAIESFESAGDAFADDVARIRQWQDKHALSEG